MTVKQWTCDKCGLTHQHSKQLHSLWDKIDWEFCKKLEYNPECNCGAREAQLRGFWNHNPPVIAVPQPVEEELVQKFG